MPTAMAAAHEYGRSLGIEMSLARHGAAAENLPQWADEAHAIRRLMDNNPRDMTAEDVLSIYRAALE